MSQFYTHSIAFLLGGFFALAIVFGTVAALERPVSDANARMALIKQEYPHSPDEYIFSPWSGRRLPK